jgi:hypothetical protein
MKNIIESLQENHNNNQSMSVFNGVDDVRKVVNLIRELEDALKTAISTEDSEDNF